MEVPHKTAKGGMQTYAWNTLHQLEYTVKHLTGQLHKVRDTVIGKREGGGKEGGRERGRVLYCDQPIASSERLAGVFIYWE